MTNRLSDRRVLRAAAALLTGGIMLGTGCKDDTNKTPPPGPATPVPTTPAVPAPGTPPTPKASATTTGNATVDAATGAASAAILANAPTAAPAGSEGGQVWANKEISWTRPAGWTQKEGNNIGRIATLVAGDSANALEVAVTKFPGDVGGALANVNRWRAQVGLEPIGEGDLAKESQPIDLPGAKGYVVDFKGPDKRLLAAALPHGAESFFVKAGPAASDAIEKHKSEFKAFVESIRFPAE